jgi:conjugative transfer signal peptidase TraF
MVSDKPDAMGLRVPKRTRPVIELQGFCGGGQGVLNALFGVVGKWGKGRWFVEQDKASAVQCRGSGVFSNILKPFPPLESLPAGELHSTGKSASEPGRSGPYYECFWHPRRTILALLGPAIAMGLLVVLGWVLGLHISLTDSAAPAGIYRLARGLSIERGQLVGACLTASIAQQGLARGYLARGDCPGGAEPVAKVVLALPGDLLEVAPAGISVDGKPFADSAVAVRDSIGRPLPHVAWGRHLVAPGEVWLFGFHNPRSWDARYYGPVPLSAVRGILKPIVIW